MATYPSRANRSVTSRMCAFTPNASCPTISPTDLPGFAGRAAYARIDVPSLTFSSTYSVEISIVPPNVDARILWNFRDYVTHFGCFPAPESRFFDRKGRWKRLMRNSNLSRDVSFDEPYTRNGNAMGIS